MLSDRDILQEIEHGMKLVEPFDDNMLQPASIDLRLGTQFRRFNHQHYDFIDPYNLPDDLTEMVDIGEGGFIYINPGECLLSRTEEKVHIPPYLSARVEGKSSLGRIGLIVHFTAGFIDPGFVGTITLEMSNQAPLPILLRTGMPIAQMCFTRLESPAHYPYGSPQLNSKYQGQILPTASRYDLNGSRSQA